MLLLHIIIKVHGWQLTKIERKMSPEFLLLRTVCFQSSGVSLNLYPVSKGNDIDPMRLIRISVSMTYEWNHSYVSGPLRWRV
jgi:hypothetical protein